LTKELTGLGGWIKNSLIDYPGTVSTVLFFYGCNLRCPFCHNKDLVEFDSAQFIKEEDVWAFLEKRRGLIDGVVISGGEPTLHPHLRKTIPEIRSMGYRVKLDTNGMLPDIARSFSPDYLALDVKTLPSMYPSLLGAEYTDVQRRLKDSIEQVKSMGDNAEVRITAVPGISDLKVIKELCGLLKGVKKIMLQPMNQKTELLDPSYNIINPVSLQELGKMRDLLSEYVDHCAIRG
jgi:pyruvate formate lyase activating enzyme